MTKIQKLKKLMIKFLIMINTLLLLNFLAKSLMKNQNKKI